MAAAGEAKREEVLKEMGLTQQDLAQTIGIDKDVPYLLNMNEDPALAGKMMYFLPLRQPITIGANQDNKIVLQGLGMPDHLCEIENLEEGVVVRTCQQPETGHPGAKSMKARVCVNGSAMKENEQRKLKVSPGNFYPKLPPFSPFQSLSVRAGPFTIDAMAAEETQSATATDASRGPDAVAESLEADVGEDTKTKKRKCREEDLEDFRHRLGSFKAPWWFNKPLAFSALAAARRGWVQLKLVQTNLPVRVPVNCFNSGLYQSSSRLPTKDVPPFAHGITGKDATGIIAQNQIHFKSGLVPESLQGSSGLSRGPVCSAELTIKFDPKRLEGQWMANGQPLADAPGGTSHEILERLGEWSELKLCFLLKGHGPFCPWRSVEVKNDPQWYSDKELAADVEKRSAGLSAMKHLPVVLEGGQEAANPADALASAGWEAVGTEPEEISDGGSARKKRRTCQPVSSLWTPQIRVISQPESGQAEQAEQEERMTWFDPHAFHHYYCPLFCHPEEELGIAAARMLKARSTDGPSPGPATSAAEKAENLVRDLYVILPKEISKD
eukprot:s3276_g5.t1